jgi:WD40 repeat protein
MFRLALALFLAAGPAWSAAPPVSELLPASARLRIGTARLRHGGLVRALAFSPDGRLLASASHDQTVSVWEIPTGHERFRCRGHEADVLTVGWSSNGKLLASGAADGTVRLWSATDGRELQRTRCSPDSVETLAFSPIGQRLAVGGDDGQLRLLDIRQDERWRMVQDRSVRCLAWSADGKLIATNAAREAITLWDPERGKPVRSFGDEPVECLAFAPRGRALVSREVGGTFRLWEIDTGREVRRWQGEADSGGAGSMIYQIAFSRNGNEVVAGNLAGGIDVWDVATGKRKTQLRGRHRGRVTAVAVSPRDDLVASGGADHAIHLWRLGKGEALNPAVEPAGPILALSLPGKGSHLAVVVGPGGVQLFDRETGRARGQRLRESAPAVSMTPDGASLIVGEARQLVVWDVHKDVLRAQVEVAAPITALAVAANGRVLATSHLGGSLWLRDAAGKLGSECQGTPGLIQPIVAPDGRLVAAVGREVAIRLWDGTTGRPRLPLAGHRGGTLAAGFSPDGKRLATGGRDSTMRIWDISSRKEVRTPAGHDAWVCAVAFSPDNRLLASGTVRGDIQLRAAPTGRLLADLEGHRGRIAGLAFTADGKTLVSASADTTVLLWDVADAHAGKALPLQMSADRAGRLWQDLRDSREVVGSLATHRLARAPGLAVPLIRKHIRPVDGEAITRLISDLDSDKFATRDAGYNGLTRFGAFAEGLLRQALGKTKVVEVKRRLEELLSRAAGEGPASEHRQALRAIEVLELIGSAEARKVLAVLAAGAADAELTRRAKAALAKKP